MYHTRLRSTASVEGNNQEHVLEKGNLWILCYLLKTSAHLKLRKWHQCKYLRLIKVYELYNPIISVNKTKSVAIWNKLPVQNRGNKLWTPCWTGRILNLLWMWRQLKLYHWCRHNHTSLREKQQQFYEVTTVRALCVQEWTRGFEEEMR